MLIAARYLEIYVNDGKKESTKEAVFTELCVFQIFSITTGAAWTKTYIDVNLQKKIVKN